MQTGSSGSVDGPRQFQTTHWSMVVAAASASRGIEHDSAGKQALESLCQCYWYPLYAFLRTRGLERHEAQDVTQAFFASLLENDRLAVADEGRGRFRSFLLASLQNFLANYRRDANAAKRGGNYFHTTLDFDDAERRFHNEPSDGLTPEKIYERRFALTLLQQAMEDLQQDMNDNGKEAVFEALKGHLVGSGERRYAEIATELDMSESAIKVTVHRMREKFRQCLRSSIRELVESENEVDDELRQFFAAFG